MEKDDSSMPVSNILYSCDSKMQRSSEQFVAVHSLGFIVSGEIHFSTPTQLKIAKAGCMGFVRRNQLLKAIKVPPSGGAFKAINILLTPDILRRYSIEYGIEASGNYTEVGLYEFPDDPFVKGYFQSLEPYFEKPERMTPMLAELKTKEAIELVLTLNPALNSVLFDFSEPYKMDLEAFMLQHYMYNVSVDAFARLTGRSRAGFKRDFEKTFKTSPGQWLKQKRLQEAYYLIKEKGIKPSDAYLDVGFENLSHFSYVFKQAYGFSPSAV